jgi:hypothetical protein
VLADAIGIETAFGVLLPLAVLTVAATVYARHLAQA